MTTLNKGDRAAAALVAGGLVALLVWALVVGLGFAAGVSVDEGLKLFAVAPPPPPPPPEEKVKPRVHNFRPQGAAAPPALRARPTEVVAPKPVVLLAPPPPVVVAPVAGTGAQDHAGAADVPGPGTGAGGEGDGRGGGGDGDGDGDGAGDVPPRRIGGRLSYSDLPDAARDEGLSGTVGVRFVVAENGRVPACKVTRSSGSRLLDDMTCRLIVQRYRFKPAHDADGAPFESVVVQNETWEARGTWGRDRDERD